MIKESFLGATLADIWQAQTQQLVYMQVLNAMSFVAKVHALPEAALSEGSCLAVIASVADAAVTLADPHKLLQDAHWPLLQAKPSACERADFVLVKGDIFHDAAYQVGSLSSPEQSTTLIVSVKTLSNSDAQRGLALRVTGPGIDGEIALHVDDLDTQWLRLHQAQQAHFPMGLDFVLVSDTQLVALPRTAKITWQTEV